MFVYQLTAKVVLANGVVYPKRSLISQKTLELIMKEFYWVSVKVKNIY